MWPETLILLALYANRPFESGELFIKQFSRIKVVKSNKYQLCSDEGLVIAVKWPTSKSWLRGNTCSCGLVLWKVTVGKNGTLLLDLNRRDKMHSELFWYLLKSNHCSFYLGSSLVVRSFTDFMCALSGSSWLFLWFMWLFKARGPTLFC